jgi:hypothetical protein
MPNWQQLQPVEQNQLLDEIATMLVKAAPPGWRQILIDYRVIGKNSDVGVGIRDANGTVQAWDPPVEVWREFTRLRMGMYREALGTWYSLRLEIDPPSRYSTSFNWEQMPNFHPDRYPAPEEFALDHKRYPRSEAHMPDWFRERLASAPPAS